MMEIGTPGTMEQIILRLEAIHRALRAAPDCAEDARVAEAVAGCLRRLHAIAAQAAAERPRLVDAAPRRLQ